MLASVAQIITARQLSVIPCVCVLASVAQIITARQLSVIPCICMLASVAQIITATQLSVIPCVCMLASVTQIITATDRDLTPAWHPNMHHMQFPRQLLGISPLNNNPPENFSQTKSPGISSGHPHPQTFYCDKLTQTPDDCYSLWAPC